MDRRPAAFLDRDGTVIEDAGFIREPDQVRLLPGAGDAVARLRAAGYAVIVVTNQSGLARGLFDWDQYHRVARRLDDLLRSAGTSLDGCYVCPHHPDITGPCPCRKPGLALYQQAALEHGLDLATSIWIGDRVRDVAPSRAWSGWGMLVGDGPDPDEGFPRAKDLAAAVTAALRR